MNFMPSQSSERNVVARFYDRKVKTGELTKNGINIYKDVTYVEIRIKDVTDVYDQEAKRSDIERFPYEYELYQRGKKEKEHGTPLSQFAFLDVSQIENCEYHGIFTVEALAELDEMKASDLDIRSEAELAKHFIEASKNNNVIDKYIKNEKKYKAEIERLKAEIEKLQSKGKK